MTLRLETARYGRLLTESFILELVVTDLADNESELASLEHATAAEPGCAASDVPGSGAPLALFALLALGVIRKRG